MASVSTLGIGSGLKLADILDSMQTAEKAALVPITKQQSAYSAKLSAYSTMSSAIETFQTANTKLNNADLFSAFKTVSSSTAFSATGTTGATPGKYSINVTALAKAQTLTTAEQTSNSTALGTSDSTLTIQSAADGSKPIEVKISAADSSLTGVRDAINKANAGVTASVIKTGDGSYRLSLTADKTGSDNAVTLSVDGDNVMKDLLNYGGAGASNVTQSVVAQNAELTVNNVKITNSSNTISDALEGITLNLNDVTTSEQSLTITKDTSSASTVLTDWVTAYNTLQDSFASLTKFTAVETNADTQDTSNGALVGDSSLRTIQQKMKSLLTNTASSSTFKTLAQIGITTDPTTGQLETDKTKLDAALAKDPAGIKEMIIGDGKKTGIATTMASNLTGWLSSKGIIQSAKDGVSKTLNNLTEQYNAANSRINDTISRLKTQFTALDLLVSKLNATNDYLTAQFEATNSNNK